MDFRDCLQRSLEGPVRTERDFDLSFSRTLREIYASYDFREDPEIVIPSDATADKIFAAAVDLLSTVGLLNKDSQRVIEFSRGEIQEIAETRLRELSLGTGAEEVVVRERTPDSDFPPVIVTGPIGGPLEEEYYLPCHLSYAQEETCQGLMGGVLLSAGGVENMANRPNELIVTRAEGYLIDQAAAEAGKPGLYLGNFPPGGVSTQAIFCNYTAEKMDPRRAQVPIQLMPELKLGWGKLDLAIYCQYHQIHPWTDIMSVIGAYCRNAVESAIAQTAGVLGAWAFTGGSTAAVWSTDLDGLCTRKRNLWASCATTRALERNVGNPVLLLGYASAGPCTEMCLLETAAYTTAYTCCGGELIWGGSSCNGIDVNAYAGLQGRMVGETARAVTGLSVDRANEAINTLYENFEVDVANAPKGKTFAECYDLATLQPSEEYRELYSRTRDKVSGLIDVRYE